MKALMSIIILVSMLQAVAEGAKNIEISSRSTNGKIVLNMKNTTSSSLFCVVNVKTENAKKRSVASVNTYELSAYEKKSVIFESNEGAIELADHSFKCVKR